MLKSAKFNPMEIPLWILLKSDMAKTQMQSKQS